MNRLSPLARRIGLLLAVVLAGATLVGIPESATAATQTYYVNCTARTNGSGSPSAPWNTLSAVKSHGAFAAGSRILLKRATTCKGQLAPSGAGTASQRNVIGAYGSGARPTVAGVGSATETGAVQITNASYWTVQDLHITNIAKSTRTTSYRAGLLFLNTGVGRIKGLTAQRLLIEKVASNVTMKFADAREWGGIAATTYGVRGDGFDGLTITHNTVENVGRTGISVSNKELTKGWDSGTRITANTVRSARGDGIVLRGNRKGRIDHNIVADSGKMLPCPECGGVSTATANAGIWPAGSQDIVIDHNEVYGQHVWGGDGEGFDIDASTKNVVLEFNYAHNNQGGGVLFCGSNGAIARFNILQNNSKSAFAFIGGAPAKNTKIYNNTIYNSKKSGAKVVRYFNGPQKTTVSFRNNLVFNYGASNYRWPGQKVTTSSNTLVGLLGTLRPHDSKTSFVNPGLKSPGSGKNGISTLKGYKPKHPSTFKKGAAIPSSVKTDFFGKKINPKHPPRGAAA